MGFSQLSPDTAMLFSPFGCTNPPPPVPHSTHVEPIFC